MENSTTIDLNPPMVAPANGGRKPVTNSEIKPTLQLVFPGLEKPVLDINELAENSNSHIFRGRAPYDGRHVGVVLKVLKYGERGDDSRRVEMFRRGAELHKKVSDHAARLGIPRVARVYDTGSLEGTYIAEEYFGMNRMDMHYILVEHVQGNEIEERLNSRDTPVEEKKSMLRQIAEGIMAAHDAGCVHRDIKPHNAVECPDEGIKLIDFGLAGSAGEITHEPAGTPLYLAPEGAIPGALDPRLDIFAFGVAAYEAVEGVHPYIAQPGEPPIGAIRNNRMRLPQSRGGLELGIANIAVVCLQKDPRRRYRDGHELLAAIDRL